MCFLGSDGKLFHTEEPAAEKLRRPRPTVLVLECGQITGISGPQMPTGCDWRHWSEQRREVLWGELVQTFVDKQTSP